MQSLEPAPASALQPTTSSERIATLDVLRGIALFGVLAANIWMWFSGVNFLFPGARQQLRHLTGDTIAFMFVSTFISGKAIRTFSFLFGLGFALQMMRAEARGRSIASVYSRRLIVLLAFGLIHAIVFWYGDILALYAVLGFGLLLFRHRTPRTVLVWAAIMMFVIPLAVASVPLVSSFTGGDWSATASAARAATAARNQTVLAAFSSGEPAKIIQGNLLMWRYFYFTPQSIGFLHFFGFFLLGLYAGRTHFFERAMDYRRELRMMVMCGFPVGIFLAIAEGAVRMRFGGTGTGLPWLPLVFSSIMIVGATPFALAYIAAATLLLDKPAWKPILGAFAPVGRMALTNYLAQTLLCLSIYYAGGLFGQFRPALGLSIAIGIFAVQMAYSTWWLSHFRFGPMEWLWRSLTYGQMQSMRIPRLEHVPAAVAAH